MGYALLSRFIRQRRSRYLGKIPWIFTFVVSAIYLELIEWLWNGFDDTGGLLRFPILDRRQNLLGGPTGLDLQEKVPVPGNPRKGSEDPDLDVGKLRGREHQEDVLYRFFEGEVRHPLAGDAHGDDGMFQVLHPRVGERHPLVAKRPPLFLPFQDQTE